MESHAFAWRDRVAIWLKVIALAPAALAGIVARMLAMKLGTQARLYIPMFFHRYVCFVLGVRYTVLGEPPERRPMLIVSNHMSWLDIIVLGSLMPLSFIAKSEVGTWPFFGLLARLQRSVFVDRQRRAATSDVKDAIAARLNAGDTMVLFGEGTTSDGSRVLPFRSALLGAARAALGNDNQAVLIQPLSIGYTRRYGLPMGRADRPFIAWYGDMELAPHLLAIFAGGPVDVTVCFGAPFAYCSASGRKEVTVRAEKIVRYGLNCAITGRMPFDDEREAA